MRIELNNYERKEITKDIWNEELGIFEKIPTGLYYTSQDLEDPDCVEITIYPNKDAEEVAIVRSRIEYDRDTDRHFYTNEFDLIEGEEKYLEFARYCI